MADNSRDFLIRIISDASKAKTDVDYVRKQLITLEDTASRVGGKLGDIERLANIDALGNEMGALAKKTGDVDAAVVQLTERLHQLGASTSEIDRATSAFSSTKDAADSAGGGGGVGGSALSQFGSKLRGLPSVQIPGAGIGTDAIANMIRVLGALPPVVLPAVAALGIVGVGFAVLTKHLEGGKKALDEAIAAENKYYQAVTDLSSAQARQQIADLERRNNAIKEENDKAAKIAAGGAQQVNNAFSGLSEIARLIGGDTAAYGAKLLEAKAVTGAVTDNIDKLNKEYSANQVEINKLTQGLNANSFAANDAAEAEKKLAAIRDQLAEDTVSRAKRDSGLARNGSQEQIQGLIDDLQAENDAINQVLADVTSGMRKLSDDELEKLHTQLSKNTTDIGDLTNNMLKLGIANDTAKQNAKDAEAAQKTLDKVKADATADEKKRADDIQALADKNTAAFDKLAESYKRAGEAAKLAAEQADAKTARTRADEDVKTALERQAKLDDINADTTQKYIDAEVKRQETLKKIRDEFAFDEASAVQDRDAVALDAARQKRDKATSEANSAADDEKKQIADDRARRLKELQKDFALQDKLTRNNRAAQDRETKIARDNDTIARRNKYFQDQNDLSTANRADILAKQNAYKTQIGDLKAYLTERITTDKGYFGTILSAATKFQSDLTAILGGSGSGSSSNNVPSGSNTVPTLPRSGGKSVPTQDFDANFALGGTTGRGAGGFNFAPTINATSAAAIRTQVGTQLDKFLKAAGVA